MWYVWIDLPFKYCPTNAWWEHISARQFFYQLMYLSVWGSLLKCLYQWLKPCGGIFAFWLACLYNWDKKGSWKAKRQQWNSTGAFVLFWRRGLKRPKRTHARKARKTKGQAQVIWNLVLLPYVRGSHPTGVLPYVIKCLSMIYILLGWCLLVSPTGSDKQQFVSCFCHLKCHSDWRVRPPRAAQGVTHKCRLCSTLADCEPAQLWKLFNLRSEWIQLTACTEPQRCILLDGMKETVHISILFLGQNQTAWNNIQKKKDKRRTPEKSFTFSRQDQFTIRVILHCVPFSFCSWYWWWKGLGMQQSLQQSSCSLIALNFYVRNPSSCKSWKIESLVCAEGLVFCLVSPRKCPFVM